jgi:hypothetical protein
MRCGAAHAHEKLLHDKAAARHGAEHPTLGLEDDGLQGFRIKAVG